MFCSTEPCSCAAVATKWPFAFKPASKVFDHLGAHCNTQHTQQQATAVRFAKALTCFRAHLR